MVKSAYRIEIRGTDGVWRPLRGWGIKRRYPTPAAALAVMYAKALDGRTHRAAEFAI